MEFMEIEADIGVQARKEGERKQSKPQAVRRILEKEETTPYMDRPYNVLEDEYYATEADNIRESSAFQIIRINIAKAGSSKIHLMLHRKSGFLGIMKIMPSQKSANARAELNALSIVKDCPFMVHLIDGFISSSASVMEGSIDTSNYYLFLEYAPFRTLDHLTQSVQGLGSTNAKDITPQNVLVLLSGHVAIADLGSALVIDGKTVTNRMCGSYVTRPPEVWNNENYTFTVDVWQFGISLFNIISNTWPFLHPNREKHMGLITSGKILFSSNFSEAATDLITNICQVLPSNRPTTQAIMKHKYFDELKYPYIPPFTPHELQEMYTLGDEESLIKELVSQLT